MGGSTAAGVDIARKNSFCSDSVNLDASERRLLNFSTGQRRSQAGFTIFEPPTMVSASGSTRQFRRDGIIPLLQAFATWPTNQGLD